MPSAIIRRSAFIAPGGANAFVCQPCAYVDTGTMVDTWATVGSCAQIGKNVHISGGAGIGGVLEPLQADWLLLKKSLFYWSTLRGCGRSNRGTGSVLSMGVFIGQSTKIINRETGVITRGRVPAYSVVVPGTHAGSSAGWIARANLYCAIILKTVDEGTRAKTSINELLRD